MSVRWSDKNWFKILGYVGPTARFVITRRTFGFSLADLKEGDITRTTTRVAAMAVAETRVGGNVVHRTEPSQ